MTVPTALFHKAAKKLSASFPSARWSMKRWQRKRQAFASSHLRALASAFQKSGSCKCSDRARNCSPLYPSLCSRSFTFHQRYRYPPFSAASLIACWTLFMGQSYKCQLLWDRRSAGNGTSGHCQVSSRAGTRPELRLPNPVAQTRNSLCRRFRLDSRKSVRPFKGIICDDVSEFESCTPSQAVPSLPANVGKHRSNGVVPRSDLQPKRRLCRTATGRRAKQGHVLFWRAFLPV